MSTETKNNEIRARIIYAIVLDNTRALLRIGAHAIRVMPVIRRHIQTRA
jgi:hypothetical protein